MYVPFAFSVDDVDAAVALARTTGFGHLAVHGPDGLSSTPVPFVVDDAGAAVRMHLARPNDVWRAAPCRALLVVPVSDAYVSPSWYPSKAEHGKVVPTWNYEVVHAHGDLVVHDDAAWVRGQIDDLTALHETSFDAPWHVDDAPDEFIESLQRGIVGVELRALRWEAKRKLSQNRPTDDRAGALAGMERAGLRGSATVVGAMRDNP